MKINVRQQLAGGQAVSVCLELRWTRCTGSLWKKSVIALNCVHNERIAHHDMASDRGPANTGAETLLSAKSTNGRLNAKSLRPGRIPFHCVRFYGRFLLSGSNIIQLISLPLSLRPRRLVELWPTAKKGLSLYYLLRILKKL